jgi:DnaK suppressor protein
MGEYQLASTNWEVDTSAFSEILEGERHAALARIRALSVEFDDIVAASADSNNDDEHDPEGPTVAFERVRTATLLDEAKAYLADLDRAEARLAAGTFSACERCGGRIAPDRLAARPVARTCITCATGTPRTGGFR